MSDNEPELRVSGSSGATIGPDGWLKFQPDPPWAGLPEYRVAHLKYTGPDLRGGTPTDQMLLVLGTATSYGRRSWVVADYPWAGGNMSGDEVHYLRCAEWELVEWIEP